MIKSVVKFIPLAVKFLLGKSFFGTISLKDQTVNEGPLTSQQEDTLFVISIKRNMKVCPMPTLWHHSVHLFVEILLL